MDWAEVAQKLGFTVDRVRRKWSKIKNTGAVSEPLFAQLPFAQLPLSYGTNPRNPKVDNSDLVAFFNMNLQDPRPTSAELERFVINGVRSLEQVHCALPVDAADTTATHSLTGALLLARRYNSGLEARDESPKRIKRRRERLLLRERWHRFHWLHHWYYHHLESAA